MAKTNSIPVALLCYNNQILGRHVVIDAYRAKESSTTTCLCTVSSDKPNTLNFTNYNGVHPEKGCGSSVIVQADGTSFSMNCFVTDKQLQINGSDVKINLEDPRLTSDTSYCISVESADSSAMLNISCEGDTLPSSTTTLFPPTTEQEETSSSSLTTGSQTTTDTSLSSPITTAQITTTTSTASQSLSTSTQSSVPTEESTSSLSTTASQTLPASSQAATTGALMTTAATSIDTVTTSSSFQTVTTSEILTTTSNIVTSGLTTEIDTTTEDKTTDNDVTKDRPESTTGNNVIESSTAPTQTPALTTTKDVADSTTARSQTSKSVTTQNLTSTATEQVSKQPVTSTSSSAILTSTDGIQSTTTKRTTPFVTTSKPLPERGTPWSGIIPAILLGIILLVVLVFAFIKCQRSREIKYPKDNENISIDKYPSMGETNFGYDAYDEGPDINAEFTKIPEEIEIDGIVLSNTTIDDVESHVQPHNLTEGPFVRYNVKDYRASGNIPKYAVVNKGTQNGPDIYF
ncbi:uncharacterized protein LOC134278325 [Saccostrea cucullata]|uniref:uncharacterized protein LOC134278325 n=1 Tax=Saccostrea cuccullata TaxID=36930 RepID=UPI002ED4D548